MAGFPTKKESENRDKIDGKSSRESNQEARKTETEVKEFPPLPLSFKKASVADRAAQTSDNLFDKTYQDSILSDTISGLNNIVTGIPDAIIAQILRSYSISPTTGEQLIPEHLITKDFFRSIVNASDYEETQEIGGILQRGVGEYIGPTDLGGNIGKQMGEFAGYALPFTGLTQKIANITPLAVSKINQFSSSLGDKVRNVIFNSSASAPGTTSALDVGFSALSGASGEVVADSFGEEYRNLGAIAGPTVPIVALKTLAYTPAAMFGRWAAKKFPGFYTDTRAENTMSRVKLAMGDEGASDPFSARKPLTWVNTKIRSYGDEIAGNQNNEVILTKDTQKKGGQIIKAINDQLEADPKNEVNMKETQRLISILDEYADKPIKLSKGEESLDKILLSAEAGVTERGSLPFIANNNKRKENLIKAIQNFATDNLYLNDEGVEKSGLVLLDTLKNKYTNLYTVNEKNLTSKISELNAAETGIDALPSVKSIGDNIRSELQIAKDNASEKLTKIATKLGINDSTVSASQDSIAASKLKLNNSLGTKAGNDGTEIDKNSLSSINPLVQKFINFEGRFSFLDWKRYRDEVGAAIGQAASQGRNNEVRQLSLFKEVLDQDIVFGTTGKLNKSWKAFTKMYDIEYAIPFENGTVKKVLKTSRVTRSEDGKPPEYTYSSAGEDVAGAFLTNSVTAANYLRTFPNSPTALPDITAVLLQNMKNYSMPPGQSFSVDKMNKWMNINKEVIKTLGLEEVFSNNSKSIKIGDVDFAGPAILTNMTQRIAQLEARREYFSKQELINTFINLGKKGQISELSSPDLLFDNIVSKKGGNPVLLNRLAKIVKNMNDPEMTKAFNSIVIEKIMNKEGLIVGAIDDTMSLTKLYNFIENNRGDSTVGSNYRGLNLDNVLGKKHVDNVLDLASMLQRSVNLVAKSDVGAGLEFGGPLKNFYNQIGTSPNSISTRGVEMASGRVSARHVFFYLTSRAFNKQQAIKNQLLMERAIIDPDFAAFLNSPIQGGSLSKKQQAILDAMQMKLGIPSFSAKRLRPGYSVPKIVPFARDATEEEKPQPENYNLPGIQLKEKPDPVPVSNYKSPFMPSEQYASTRPNAPMPNMASNNTMVSDLFPNDPTSRAIENRRMQGGIGSLA